MNTHAPRLLYLDAYTVPDPKHGPLSSDAIGYSITASRAIRRGLTALGFEILRPQVQGLADGPEPLRRLRWLLSSYAGMLDALIRYQPDVVFVFHVFTVFPVEIRRMMLDLGMTVPLVGYTHGSHWDPTDTFRFVAYPGMEMADLANLHVLDRLLLVSNYMRTTLRSNIAVLNPALATQVDNKARVVGIPLDTQFIDACRTDDRLGRTTIVFNHAPVESKNPDVFVRAVAPVLQSHDVAVLFTRRFGPGAAGAEEVTELAARFPEQVVLGDDMPLADYYRALWMADLQVSTATHESLGVSTLEAMYTGTCCILPRLGSYPDICAGHPDVLYELGAEELRERLCYFLDHPDRRWQVGEELRQLAARYHPDVVVRQIAAAIRELDGPQTRSPQRSDS